jgi:catechol 2,3-dioxygenase-like lactoylglutathione lyase family enzyme
MNSGIHTVIYPVDDLGQAKALYQALLGTEPYVDEPYYVGFRLGDQELASTPTGIARERPALSRTTTSTTSRNSSSGSARPAPHRRATSETSAAASWSLR